MDPQYDHQKYEKDICKLWETSKAFTPKRDKKKKPYTIILPLPNASGKMHVGNVLMIAIEDLLIRRKRMQGFSTLWIPGTDHAGFETQITFERHLKKEGKSRFDFDRQTLYKKIWDFVQENKSLIEEQIRQMGASVDWTRYKFSLDPDVVKTVLNTFQKLHKDNLLYRDDYLVNYCPVCGTTFADLEVQHQERKDPLYYIKYGPLTVATVRPETMFGDTAIAVNPKDKRYKKFIGQELTLPLTSRKIPIIADPYVDMKFGTGVLKITPAHDPNDFKIGKKHNLKSISVINMYGRIDLPVDATYKEVEGKRAKTARDLTVKELESKGYIDKVDTNYTHAVTVCYKAGHDIEPTIIPNWFVKVKSLKKPAHDAVKTGKVKIFPKWQESKYHRWMESMLDWPISRQVVWGIRIPAWYNIEQKEDIHITFLNKKEKIINGTAKQLLKEYSFKEIASGLQTLLATKKAKYIISQEKPKGNFLQETDTLDTWFSSGQWPLVTLGYPDSADFKYFYPTDVLETAWEILRLWVSRMLMFGIYLTGKPPFKDIYLHGIVRALDGKKMSKSLGNVIIPEQYQKEFGTDALRMGLVTGTAMGKDFNFPKDKVIAYKKFNNKLWNMARFISMLSKDEGSNIPTYSPKSASSLKSDDKKILTLLNSTIKEADSYLEGYKFAQAAETIYHFVWDSLASTYLESIKTRKDKKLAISVLKYAYLNSLKLLHPFIPFVTEAIYQELFSKGKNDLLITSHWPEHSSS